MIVTLQIERLRTIEQLKAFVAGSAPVDCKPLDRESAYDFVRRTLVAFDYHRQGKADRGCVRRYIVKVTGLSPAQLTRLVADTPRPAPWWTCARATAGDRSRRRYRPIDIRLLAEVDQAFGQMSGLATCEILRRAFEVHGDPRFERLAGISRSHVYNLRGSRTYRAKRTTWTKTKGSNVAIAVRKAPEPNGVPILGAALQALCRTSDRCRQPVVQYLHSHAIVRVEVAVVDFQVAVADARHDADLRGSGSGPEELVTQHSAFGDRDAQRIRRHDVFARIASVPAFQRMTVVLASRLTCSPSKVIAASGGRVRRASSK